MKSEEDVFVGCRREGDGDVWIVAFRDERPARTFKLSFDRFWSYLGVIILVAFSLGVIAQSCVSGCLSYQSE